MEISELNLRLVLNPKQYIRDQHGNYFNDPVFEDYVQPKGLSKTESKTPVPIRFVPRAVRSQRPAHAVTQATSFVRDSNGQTLPVYAAPPQVISPDAPMNKNPVMGMTVEMARKLGFAGRPRLVSEDYGLTDGTGAPPDKNLPPIKVSIESPPRLRTAAPLTPQLAEALNDPALSIQERQSRSALQQSLGAANRSVSGENFDPSTVRPHAGAVPLRAPSEPSLIVGGSAVSAPIEIQPAPRHVVASPKGKAKKGKKAEPVVATAEPEAMQSGEPVLEGESPIQGATPISESMPDPTLESPPTDQPEKRFVCAADGRGFKFRSELLRYVKAKYPSMTDDLMGPYPPEPDGQ